MSSGKTISGWEFDYTDHNGRGLVTGISRAMSLMSGNNRAKRRKKQLRESLVREHIMNQQRERTPHLKLLMKKLFRVD